MKKRQESISSESHSMGSAQGNKARVCGGGGACSVAQLCPKGSDVLCNYHV